MKKKNNYDVIVVGSGPGGASVARDLTKAGAQVLILEWGSDEPIDGSIAQAVRNVALPGKSMLFTYGGLSMVRATTLGGSSVYYYATAFDPPHEMLAKYGVDVVSDVAAIREELPIAPLSDELMGPMAKRLMASARELGYDWQKLDKNLFQENCRPDCDKCNLGCPHGAKWTSRFYAEEAVRDGATLLAGARVRRVVVEGGKATGVVFTRRGREFQANADTVIVSAGGIGTPVVLRASGIPAAGHDYFYDPLISVWGTVDDIEGGREFPMAAGAHMHDEGYLMTDMTIPKILYQAFVAEVGRVDRAFSHSHTLSIMVKAKDSLGGHLTDSGGVRKHLADVDRAKLMKGYERARGILENAGARHIFKSWFIAAHPGGTAKIGDVVDANLKTEFDNLYVCDCSVIPEPWGLPPSLTLLAFGRRLARHLAKTSENGKSLAAAA